MKIFKLFIIFLGCLFLLTSCSGVKQGLTNSKKNNRDEFLVQKKNPLVLPPKFNELPKPRNQKNDNAKLKNNVDVKKLLEDYNVETKQDKNNENVKSIEDSILDKINQN